MSRTAHLPVAMADRPSDRLEALALRVEDLASQLVSAVQKLKEETEHDPAD